MSYPIRCTNEDCEAVLIEGKFMVASTLNDQGDLVNAIICPVCGCFVMPHHISEWGA